MSTLTHYHKCVRKITSGFASLFNNIVLIRENENGTESQRIVVPIEYGDKEKFVKRLQGDPELDKKIQVLLPRMSYELVGFSYDSTRKLNTNNKNFGLNPTNPTSVFMQYNPVPYDFVFSLSIYTRNIEDGNQIVEQILPFFTPDYSLRLNLVPEMNAVKVIPVILNDVKLNIDADGIYNSEVRTVIWTLSFTVKGFIFGAIKDAKLITYTEENVVIGDYGTFANVVSGVCCSSDSSRTLYMDANGVGSYSETEIVYQGQNLELAYATAKVDYWDNTSKELVVSEICGKFRMNQPVIGTETFSIHTPKNADNINIPPSMTIKTFVEANAPNVIIEQVTSSY